MNLEIHVVSFFFSFFFFFFFFFYKISNTLYFFEGKNTTALLLWGWDGAILMQAYHCIFAVGTLISPWIAAPFILQDHKRMP